ncbi:MAG: hypothetical protein GY810_20695 [Aureispira sp.]|nr:hypothetical protein [Aureispira sp.]
MNIGCYIPFTTFTPQFQHFLNLMEDLTDKGMNVMSFGCGGELPACYTNVHHSKSKCNVCLGRRKRAIEIVDPKIKHFDSKNLSSEDEKAIADFLAKIEFKNISDVKKVTYGKFDVGMAVASSLITNFRNPNPDLSKHTQIVRNFFEASVSMYVYMLNNIKQYSIEEFYIFNGRHGITRAAIRAAEHSGIDYYSLELGSAADRYRLAKNALPHNAEKLRLRIIEDWKKADKATREKDGCIFFEDKKAGRELHKKWNYIKDQVAGLLPKDWDHKKKNIVIFNSSEDEYEAVKDGRSGSVYPNQREAIRLLTEGLLDQQDSTRVYLRMHPNMANKEESANNFLAIKSPILTTIPPLDPISTYDLVENADIVVAFHSTVGIEAAYAGKPVVVLGSVAYKTLGSTYDPDSHEETLKLLQSDLVAKPKEGALMYGHYFMFSDIKAPKYKYSDLHNGTYKGHNIRANFLVEVRNKALALFDKPLS